MTISQDNCYFLYQGAPLKQRASGRQVCHCLFTHELHLTSSVAQLFPTCYCTFSAQ